MGDMRNAENILVRKTKWKRPLERHGHRYEDYIKIDHREIRCKGMGWIHMADQRQALVNMAVNLWVL
jgi:hypothetical protein